MESCCQWDGGVRSSWQTLWHIPTHGSSLPNAILGCCRSGRPLGKCFATHIKSRVQSTHIICNAWTFNQCRKKHLCTCVCRGTRLSNISGKGYTFNQCGSRLHQASRWNLFPGSICRGRSSHQKDARRCCENLDQNVRLVSLKTVSGELKTTTQCSRLIKV